MGQKMVNLSIASKTELKATFKCSKIFKLAESCLTFAARFLPRTAVHLDLEKKNEVCVI
jgi:hypothetical protein